MGLISFAAFRPKPGREQELLTVIDERVALMRSLGLVTERPVVNMRAGDGTIIQVSEWASQEAIDRAHETPEVLALWRRYEECADHVMPGSLPDLADPFPCFETLGP